MSDNHPYTFNLIDQLDHPDPSFYDNDPIYLPNPYTVHDDDLTDVAHEVLDFRERR
jgi:hypothetical protein